MTLPHLVQDRPPGQLRKWRHPPERFLVRWQPNRASRRGGGEKKPSPVSPGLSFPVLAQEVHEHRWLQQAAISSSAPLKPAIDRGLICVERNVGYKGRAWWDGDGRDTGMTGKCFIRVTLQRLATRGHQNHKKSSKSVIACVGCCCGGSCSSCLRKLASSGLAMVCLESRAPAAKHVVGLGLVSCSSRAEFGERAVIHPSPETAF